jgi:hypothetical protein
MGKRTPARLFQHGIERDQVLKRVLINPVELFGVLMAGISIESGIILSL